MTTEQMEDLAATICNNLEPEEWGQMADILFNFVEALHSVEDVQVIANQLLAAGVDVKPICKRKHPA